MEPPFLEVLKKYVDMGTWGYGLEMNIIVVLGWWLDLVIIDVFSDLHNSMIQWFWKFDKRFKFWINGFPLICVVCPHWGYSVDWRRVIYDSYLSPIGVQRGCTAPWDTFLRGSRSILETTATLFLVRAVCHTHISHDKLLKLHVCDH